MNTKTTAAVVAAVAVTAATAYIAPRVVWAFAMASAFKQEENHSL